MAKLCEVCGKIPGKGRTISHAQNKSNRRFKPNLKKVRIPVGTSRKRAWVCTKCLRNEKKVTAKAKA